MVYLIAIALALTTADPLDTLVEVAATNCRNAGKRVDRGMLRKILNEEIKAGWPDRYRGAVLAAACHESGYNPLAKGDCRKERGKRVCKAVGLLQLWPWAKIDRRDPVASARLWTRQIARTVKKAKRKKCRRPWITAWNWVATGPNGWRCDRVPNHVRVLRRLQRLWRAKN
jgi:hypothetical protein